VKEVVVVVLGVLLLGNICTVGPVRKSGYQSPEEL
jgi:hypothetical protein